MKKVLLLLLFFGIYHSAMTCTTILIGKQCTIDGSTILAHNEDMGFNAVGKLWHEAAKKCDTSCMISIPYISYDLKQTYAYWASGNARAGNGLGKSEASDFYHKILVGMNEHGLSMACNWMNSKEDALQKKGINRYALRQLVLETQKTAQEAVIFIGMMIETYGQADWSGLTWCLADNQEAWIIETTASQWVARKILNNEIHTVANQFTIGEQFDLHSENLFQYAIQKGWYNKNSPFSFRKVYGKTAFMDTHYDQRRESRVEELLSSKKGVITVNDVMDVLRDRYDDTPEFTLPMTEECWRELCMRKDIKRPISTNITQSSSIAHLRNDVNDAFSNVLWYSLTSPSFNAYFPIYAKATFIPKKYSEDGLVSENAWQLAKKIQMTGNENYAQNNIAALSFWKIYENELQFKMQLLEAQLKSTKEIDLVGQFTYAAAADLLRQQQKLLKAFFTNKND